MTSETLLLSKDLQKNPMPMVQKWLDHARKNAGVPNSHAMALSSCYIKNNLAYPSTRMVLLKHIAQTLGYIVFYTNYESRKGIELLANQRASALLFWDNLGWQVRMEGHLVKSPASESDAYFASRNRQSQIGAWASAQSQPIASRDHLIDKFNAVSAQYSNEAKLVPRPPNWGGFRLWLDHVELWTDGQHRIHDRAIWQRSLPDDNIINSNGAVTADTNEWQSTRLQP